ncbi:T6SS phospholipase effector Tle1-like catalytic domain-containing protein [Marinobacter sp. JSM 1782161]|uniref:phospholipase effector Tle1 domain-containing protein n=1 Tax=Marinobacter sp. JSM 1782161 TaxID=2685906 RepID=UPI001402FC91|nr:DUF2235 domain-containing protein [Marinobacter sp. JSM 1782161]
MNIKRPRELVLSDLPRIESPTFAAHAARPKLDNPASPLLWDKTSLQTSRLDRPLSDQDTADKIAQALSKGELLLVYSSIDGSPINPVVTWRESGSLPGRWLVQKDLPGLFLNQQVARLNDRQITPNQIERLGPEGIGHLSLSGFDIELRQREIEEKEQAQSGQRNNLSLPVGAAAAVAPVVAEASQEETSAEKELHVEVGIFLDGTGNNATNTEILNKKIESVCLNPHRRGEISEAECEHRLGLLLGTSYTNTKTNVHKLWSLYQDWDEETPSTRKVGFAIYAEGVGTTDGEDDSAWSMATGIGGTGIIEQVKLALRDVTRLLASRVSTNRIDSLTLDIFGFSRGAAAARHTIHTVTEGTTGLLGEAFGDFNLEWPQNVIVRFAGLFDTVAGVVNLSAGDLSASNSENAPVHVYLNPQSVKSAVHLTALDECRQNFALNSLRDVNGALPANFHEIKMPGAHSDVGGGYAESSVEAHLLNPSITVEGFRAQWPEETMAWDNLETIKSRAISDRWIGPHSLPLPSGETASIEIEKTNRNLPGRDEQVTLNLRMTRYILGSYSLINLYLMHDLATENHVPLSPISGRDDLELPEELDALKKRALEEVKQGSNQPKFSSDQLDLLKQRYVHHSDHYDLLETMLSDSVIKLEVPTPELSPFKPAEGRQRIVHPNQPETS